LVGGNLDLEIISDWRGPPLQLERTSLVHHSSGQSKISLKYLLDEVDQSKMKSVRAVFKYESTNEEELSLNLGEIVIVSEEKDGWSFGVLNSKSGWFPSTHVQDISDQAPVVAPRKRNQHSTQVLQNVNSPSTSLENVQETNSPKPLPNTRIQDVKVETPILQEITKNRSQGSIGGTISVSRRESKRTATQTNSPVPVTLISGNTPLVVPKQEKVVINEVWNSKVGVEGKIWWYKEGVNWVNFREDFSARLTTLYVEFSEKIPEYAPKVNITNTIYTANYFTMNLIDASGNQRPFRGEKCSVWELSDELGNYREASHEDSKILSEGLSSYFKFVKDIKCSIVWSDVSWKIRFWDEQMHFVNPKNNNKMNIRLYSPFGARRLERKDNYAGNLSEFMKMSYNNIPNVSFESRKKKSCFFAKIDSLKQWQNTGK
jgi:hypothetical protein